MPFTLKSQRTEVLTQLPRTSSSSQGLTGGNGAKSCRCAELCVCVFRYSASGLQAPHIWWLLSCCLSKVRNKEQVRATNESRDQRQMHFPPNFDISVNKRASRLKDFVVRAESIYVHDVCGFGNCKTRNLWNHFCCIYERNYRVKKHQKTDGEEK